MMARVNLDRSLKEISDAFERVDRGDASHVRSLDILLDWPNVLSLARFIFSAEGIGYELISSSACGLETHMCAIRLVSPACIIRQEPWGTTGAGCPQQRAWYGAISAT